NADLKIRIKQSQTPSSSAFYEAIRKTLSRVPLKEDLLQVSLSESPTHYTLSAKDPEGALGSYKNFRFFPLDALQISNSKTQDFEFRKNGFEVQLAKDDNGPTTLSALKGVMLF